jgi:hypothetical protein
MTIEDKRSHDGETLAQARDRFGDNLEDPFDRHRKSRGRMGWKDTIGGHSLVNVAVSWAREDAYGAGHMLVYALIVIILLAALSLFLLGWIIF